MAGYYAWLVLLLSPYVMGLRIFRRNEISRGFAPEDAEFFVEILSMKATDVGLLVQSGRKFLQKVREWHGTHPAESVLAKCVLHYWIEEKIPGIVATTQEDDYEDGRRGLSTPVYIEQHHTLEPQSSPNFHDSNMLQDVPDRMFGNDEVTRIKPSLRSIDDGMFKFKRKIVKALYLLYMELKDILNEYKLISCSTHYLIAKFWEWVDNAP